VIVLFFQFCQGILTTKKVVITTVSVARTTKLQKQQYQQHVTTIINNNNSNNNFSVLALVPFLCFHGKIGKGLHDLLFHVACFGRYTWGI